MEELKKEDTQSASFPDSTSCRRLNFTLPDRTAHLIFWPLLLLGTTLDMVTKSAVFSRLSYHDTVPVIDGFIQLVKTVNSGAAFGIAAGKQTLLAGISIVALIVVFYIFLFSGIKKRLMHISLGLFAAGICGNLYDRLFNDGLVRDFIDIIYWPGKHWPAFNVADSMLCIAVGLMFINTCFFTDQPDQKHAQQQK